jgi:hypothetical protein
LMTTRLIGVTERRRSVRRALLTQRD